MKHLYHAVIINFLYCELIFAKNFISYYFKVFFYSLSRSTLRGWIAVQVLGDFW